MTLQGAKGKPNRRFFLGLAGLGLAGLALALAGCSTFEGAPIVPTGSVRSSETTRPGEYPAVGVTPPAPAPNLSPADRDRLRSDLASARESNRAAAGAPLDRPLPARPSGEAQTQAPQQQQQRPRPPRPQQQTQQQPQQQ